METDTSYSLKLLKKVNSLVVDGKPVNEYFLQGTYSLWSFQQFFLLAQIKEFSQYKDYGVYKNVTGGVQASLFTKGKILLMNIFMLAVSFLALIKIIILKPRVLLFCSDILKPGTRFNPRLSNIFAVLASNHTRYIEIVHTVGGKKLFTNFFKLRRLVFYSESIHVLQGLLKSKREIEYDEKVIENISLDSFVPAEKEFIRELLQRAFENIRISRFKISLLGRVFKKSGMQAFITIDDVRHTNEIITACKDAKIPSYIFQHSNFDYLVGLDELPKEQYIFPDVFFVWNTYWYKRLPEISPLYSYYKERIKIGGRAYSFSPGECGSKKEDTIREDTISVLVPSEINLNSSQVRPYMKAFLGNASIRLSFLVRGDYDREEQISKYFEPGDLHNSRLSIVEPSEKVRVHKSVDVVAGVYSGFLDESIEMCKPVAVLSTDYPILNKIHTDKLAVLLDLNGGDLYAQLAVIRDTPQSILSERRNRIIAGTGDAQKTTLEILRG